MNARALATFLHRARTVDEALPVWEAAVRSVSDKTQRWALWYDYFSRQWPAPLWFMRPPIIWAFRSLPSLSSRLRIADRGLDLPGLEVEGDSARDHASRKSLSGRRHRAGSSSSPTPQFASLQCFAA